ncbi:methyl-accepting chemotaxis protein [Sporomusa sp.]|uniref:methyl-accepting chemotaxis protein n=1 Tax=Sporomusa sp. TaxID=2078658 RepID=UPI002C0BB7FF|nr:methyl-accepting chemotaxis protein [Sporomusa sp.]HWR44685.1 methyl-accepting chemotaxis protein [Sporomusa sp.]
MKFFDNIKVSLKLGILISVALLALTIIGYTGYYYLEQANADMNTIYTERLIPVKLLNESCTLVERANAATLELVVTTDAGRKQELKKIIEDTVVKSNANLAEVEKAHLDVQGKVLFDKMQVSKQKFRETRQSVLELALQNKNAEAYAVYVTKVYPLAVDFMKQLSDLSMHYAALSEKMNMDNQAAFRLAIQKMIVIFVAAFVMLGLSGLYIARIITKPLLIMVTACKEFAAGDFRDKPRRLIRKDEIGQLADAMADMRGNLRTLLKQVNVSVEQVAASSEELTASADQSAQAASQVAGSITGVAKGMEAQLATANDTSAVVQQMSASIQQVAANANDVAGKSAQAADKASEGNKSVHQAVNQMANVEQTVATSAGVVAKLGERSQEIGQIVDTISGIAGQTNLLALNAAIEAARAGEQGRGFAVVAEEVRKLAEQSQEAAKQIATLISEIQGDTNKAVEAMSHGTREVKKGTEVVNASGQAFEEIAVLVTQVSLQIKGITTAIGQMAAGSQQIVGSVNQIDELSKKASGEAQTVSAATEEQSASMEEIASSSQALARLAMDLRDAVSKFQI